MAEQLGTDSAREKSLGTSLSSGDLPRGPTDMSMKGPGTPGKTRKLKKVSLFKKTHEEGGGFMRSSGRGKKKSGKDKKPELQETPLQDAIQHQVEAPLLPPIQPSGEACYQYDIGTQELEQKSAGELSVKKVQKLNKELAKLQKSVDTLKKEKELLVSEKVKLKSENRSLEKELKKVNSKERLITRRASQSTLEESACDSDVLKEKIQVLEDQLTEKDRVAALLKLRMDKSHDESSELEDLERSTSSVRGTRNGSVLDPTVTLEMLLEEHDISLKLRRENEELKSRLLQIEDSKGQQREHSGQQSPKSPRKRSSSFFKRGKKTTSSMPLTRHHDSKGELVRSQSPEGISITDLRSDSPPPFHHPNKESTTSLPTQRSSPSLSPNMANRSRAKEEILTLQSCLKLAIEEKNASNESRELLEKELNEARNKISKMNESSSHSAAQTANEIGRLKKFLNAAEIERDTFRDELKIAQHEIDEMIEKKEELDQKHAIVIAEKDSRIKELEDELENIKKTKILSPTSNKPPLYGATSSQRKQPQSLPSRERILSPPQQYKDATFSKLSTESSSSEKSNQGSRQLSSEKSRERFTSSSSSGSSDLAKPGERLPSSDGSDLSSTNRLSSSNPSKPRERVPSDDLSKKESSKPKERVPSANLPSRLSSGDFSKPKEKVASDELSKRDSSKPRERVPSADLPSRHSSSDFSKPRERVLSSDSSSRDASKPRERVPSTDLSSNRLSSSDLSKSRERVPSADVPNRLSSSGLKPKEKVSSGDLPKSKEKLSSSDLSKPRDRLSSSDLSKSERSGRLQREKSQDKLTNVPPSPTRKVGRLSRESSIDRFETPPKEIKRKISNSGISSPSLVHSPKVSATRAMFEQKIDDSKSDQSKKSSLLEQKRRKSIPTVIPVRDNKAAQPMHSKSNSYDYSSKEGKLRKTSESSTGSADKPESAPTTSPMEQANGPKANSNEARTVTTSSQSQQQEKTYTVTSSVASRKENSSSPVKSSESSGTKMSRIIVTSVASPGSSPVLSNRKEITSSSSSREERSQSPLLSRNSTSPSLTSSTTYSKASPPASTVKGSTSQANSTTKISTVSAIVRHSSPLKSATVSEISTPPAAKPHSPVTKSQTESKLQPPSVRTSGLWSNSSGIPQITTSTISSTPAPNRVVVKTTSRLGGNLTSANKSGGSLQDIPAQVNGTTSKTTSPESPAVVSTPSTTAVIRRGPVHKAIQRRDRKERPKTMYAGRAETTNLVNLISKFQEAEKEKQQKKETQTTSTVSISSSAPRSVSPQKQNGASSPVPTTSSPANSTRSVNFSSTSNSTTTSSSSVTLRHHGGKDKLPRPMSYSSNNTTSINSLKPSLGFQAPSSYSSKPPPHERMLQRSRTVAGGLGCNKQSKKAMLLRWCQMVTQDYENVNISNFAESFSNGLAFCAMMHHFLPDQIPFNTLSPANRESNFKIAFQAAEGVGIPSLLDVEDMVSLPTPDWMSVMTYVSFIYNKFGQQNQQLQQSSMV